MNEIAKYISNILALRKPQVESLKIFSQILEILKLEKNPDLESELQKIHEKFPTLTDFERKFPSICFSLATGIGKTRLMGACIAYLAYAKNIKNFFVMAPNLTIYEKLKKDLGSLENPKYVFRGLDKFVNPPRIIDGDNYESFRAGNLFNADEIIINVFNISKLNSDSKVENGKAARIKRLNEILGESYFEYLKNLSDLCIFMDESHHYHADKSFEVINELQPILGVELTATPQIQKGAKKILFKNVVYEYSLASALNDEKFVKVPVVFTRKDFRPEEFTPEQLDREKLIDGVRLHEETKNILEIYARENNKNLVKPFVLVVAKDTAHSKNLLDFIQSENFFGGRYAEKVIEVNSALRGAEKDENIKKLLALENPENKIEIVIHVNMLKEGWDVTNLYTIVPLRTSASETLTEQTIGRGLRLPYGERTGIAEVDRLSIVSHDKYAEIVNLANDKNSIFKEISYIEAENLDDAQKEVVECQPKYDFLTTSENFTTQIAEKISHEKSLEIAKFVQKKAATSVIDLNRQVKNFNAIKDSDTQNFLINSIANETVKNFSVTRDEIKNAVETAVETCVENLTENIITIPRAVIKATAEVRQEFHNFSLDCANIHWQPSEDIFLGTELKNSGETFSFKTKISTSENVDSAENEIIRHVTSFDNIDYKICAELLKNLIADAKNFFRSYLTDEETEKVMRERQKSLAEEIYRQMNKNFYRAEISFSASKMRPFSRILPTFGAKIKADEIYDLRANLPLSEVPKKIFQGCKKSCHIFHKFDSNPERIFAIVLEQDDEVLKWLRPAAKQFDIFYSLSGARYEPDFVVETAEKIFMVEVKNRKNLKDDDVQAKATAGKKYCESAMNWNVSNGGKAWKYILLADDDIKLNSSFKHLLSCGR